MKNPKQKGNDHELKVAKLLTEWSGQKFHRTPASGALHWPNDKRVVSDIVPPQTLEGWPFSVECKKVETSWEFNTFIEGTSQTLKEHWKQCCEDAKREEMVPLLVFTKNYRDIYMMVDMKTFDILGVQADHLELKTWENHVVIMRFSDFLKEISLDELLKKDFKLG